MNTCEANYQIQIVGAGPGATDLITVRGFKALENADFVLYAGSLVNEEHLKICPSSCVCKDSADMNLEEQVKIMAEFALQGKSVVRLHTGDPAMYGAINEQIRLLAEQGIAVKIVPGVSSVFGAAAALGCELTAPEISQSVILTRTPGRTPMPEKEKASYFAKSGATLVFFLSTGKIEELMKDLYTDGELPKDTPAAVVYRATWAEERIFRGTVENIAQKVQDAGFGRQALIFVGKAIGVAEENNKKLMAASKLYAKEFSHGYRNNLAKESFKGSCALYAFTAAGLARAKEIAYGLKLPMEIYAFGKSENFANHDIHNKHASIVVEYMPSGSLSKQIQKNWNEFDAHIFIGATGIAIRSIAPLLKSKLQDPAIISCPDSGSHVMSLVSGHIGGANRLARRVARITGGQAVISTATDLQALPSFDEVVMAEGARILNPEAIRHLNAAILANKPIDFIGKKAVFDKYFTGTCVSYKDNVAGSENAEYALYWDMENAADTAPEKTLFVDSRAFVLGIGCRKDVEFSLLKSSLEEFLQEHSLSQEHIAKITSCNLKSQENALLELAKEMDTPTEFYEEEFLNTIDVPHPSQNVAEKIGTHSVCEASALNGASYPHVRRLYAPKTSYASCITFALARLPHGKVEDKTGSCGEMLVVGLGSGSMHHITPQVIEALESCDVVAGYTPYVDYIRHLVSHKNIIQNGMMGEVARCVSALEHAAKGHKVCMVCSGDPGILAMAGLLMELRHSREDFAQVPIKVLPGITSANIAAASLGAPLQNGFCLVSLSDLLVPSDEVRKNIRSVAQSALPVALYNPAGKKRRELMAEAIQIFTDARGSEVLCAYVKNAGRDTEKKWVGKIAEFPQEEVDMSTLLIIGGERTLFDGDFLYEARGYAEKYGKD